VMSIQTRTAGDSTARLDMSQCLAPLVCVA
jgi:hypothetical protein